MPTPRLSNLQFLVLGTLRSGPRTGRAIREELESFDVRKNGPAFYQLMSRLEASELVSGDYQQEIVASQIIRERRYELLPGGREAWDQNRDFHLEVIRRFGAAEGSGA